MQVTSDVVQHVAQLSLLHLTDERTERFTEQLNVILNYALKLYEVDVIGVTPTSHALAIAQVLRPDEVKPSLLVEETLASAPDQGENCFIVPAVLE